MTTYPEEVQCENTLRKVMRQVDAEAYNRIRKMYQAANAHTSISFIEFVTIAADVGKIGAFDELVGS